MTTSPVLSRKLQESLGRDTGEDLVTWMDQTDTTLERISKVEQSVHELQLGHARLEGKMDAGFARLETLIERMRGDLMKWSFVFWVGAVAAIAMLAGVVP